jgi:hypothetical protein
MARRWRVAAMAVLSGNGVKAVWPDGIDRPHRRRDPNPYG